MRKCQGKTLPMYLFSFNKISSVAFNNLVPDKHQSREFVIYVPDRIFIYLKARLRKRYLSVNKD